MIRPNTLTGFEVIALDRLLAGERDFAADDRVLLSLARKRMVQLLLGGWALTPRGRAEIQNLTRGMAA
jgi:hypothetical protein